MKMPMVLGTIGQNKIGEGAEPSSGAFSLSSNDTVGASIDTSKWDLNRVNIVYDTENTPVPVPKGFTASGTEGEHTVNTGFVIYEGEEEVNDENAWDESCTRNQFVWIPVYDTSRVYEEIGTTEKKKAMLWEFSNTGRTRIENGDNIDRREPGILLNSSYNNHKKRLYVKYEMEGYTIERMYKEITIAFDTDMESISRYGGFYIGRYETGNMSSEQPVVKRMNTTISNQNWYAMYSRMKNISTNENVEISMIWGCLWDETLQWLIDTEAKTQAEVGSDSTEWGNYKNASFTYTNTSGETMPKFASIDTKIPTGSTERNKSNNIYDMAGNVYELTLEGDGSSRNYSRGGFFKANSRFGSFSFSLWSR